MTIKDKRLAKLITQSQRLDEQIEKIQEECPHSETTIIPPTDGHYGAVGKCKLCGVDLVIAPRYSQIG